MRHLAQQSYYDNFYGNQGQFNTLKQKYKTQLCKHWLEQSKCPLAQYCQFAHGEDDLRQPNDVSSVIELSYLILFFFSATSKELRQDCSRCSALQLQDDPMQVLVRDRSMQVRWGLLILSWYQWEEKTHRPTAKSSRGCYAPTYAWKT